LRSTQPLECCPGSRRFDAENAPFFTGRKNSDLSIRLKIVLLFYGAGIFETLSAEREKVGKLRFRQTVLSLRDKFRRCASTPTIFLLRLDSEQLFWGFFVQCCLEGTIFLGHIGCHIVGSPKQEYQQDEDFRVVIYRPETAEGSSHGPSQEVFPISVCAKLVYFRCFG